MKHRGKLLCGLITLSVLLGHNVVGQAAEAQNAQKPAAVAESTAKEPVKAPITIEGDDISFDNTNGNVYAKGNIIITQTDVKVKSDDMHGNTRSADVWADGNVEFNRKGEQKAKSQHELDESLFLPEKNAGQPHDQMAFNANDAFYNYEQQKGSLQEFKGRVDDKYMSGSKVEFSPEEIIVYNGTVTKCPGKRPDYHIAASKIEIWPNNKMIAYDAKFYLKGKVIYSTKRYESEIGTSASGNTPFPRVGYNTTDGFHIQQHLEQPLSEKVSAFTNLGYYSKHGEFKGDIGLIQRNKKYDLIYDQGYFEDDDDKWIKKQGDFKIKTHEQQIGSSPYSYHTMASIGHWNNGDIWSWHKEAEVYFTRKPIYLTNSMSLNLGAGYNIVHESYNDSKINTSKQDIVLKNKFSDKFLASTGYHYTKKNDQNVLFDFDSADVAKELKTNLRYRADSKNTFRIEQSYDISGKNTVDLDYYWYHDLHCATVMVEYREKRDEWKVRLSVKNW